MNEMNECTCNGEIFTDSMCQVCLKVVERKLIDKIENLHDRLSDLESDLDQVQFHLDNPNFQRVL